MEITAIKSIPDAIKWLFDNPYFVPIAIAIGIIILRQKFEKIGREQADNIDRKLIQIKNEVTTTIDNRFKYIENSINTIKEVGEKLGELEPMNKILRENIGLFRAFVENYKPHKMNRRHSDKKETRTEIEHDVNDIAMGMK